MGDTPARYRGMDESIGGSRTLIDAEYRLFIKARILKNHSTGTINDVLNSAVLLTGISDIVLTEQDPATITLTFGTPMDPNTKVFLENNNLIPKPAGVQMILVD
jgi:hypothetical protein